MTQNRWKSKVLWGTIIAQVLALLGMFGLYAKLGITQEWLQGVLIGILQLLGILGVLNNPTDKDNF